MDKWHIIYTQTYKEKYLDYQIKNLGLKTYLPLYKRSVSHSRKVIEKTYSLFPRYLFVKFDVNKSTYNHLKKLHGLEEFIRSDSKLVTISDEIIKKIKDKEDEGGYIDITKFFDLIKGKKYKFSNGSLKNLHGIFLGKFNDKFKFLVQMFNKELELTLPNFSFEPA